MANIDVGAPSGGFSTWHPLEKIFHIMSTVGGRPDIMPGLKRQEKEFELNNLLKTLQAKKYQREIEEEERLSKTPATVLVEGPTGREPAGDIEPWDPNVQYEDRPTFRQEVVPGLTMRDIYKGRGEKNLEAVREAYRKKKWKPARWGLYKEESGETKIIDEKDDFYPVKNADGTVTFYRKKDIRQNLKEPQPEVAPPDEEITETPLPPIGIIKKGGEVPEAASLNFPEFSTLPIQPGEISQPSPIPPTGPKTEPSIPLQPKGLEAKKEKIKSFTVGTPKEKGGKRGGYNLQQRMDRDGLMWWVDPRNPEKRGQPILDASGRQIRSKVAGDPAGWQRYNSWNIAIDKRLKEIAQRYRLTELEQQSANSPEAALGLFQAKGLTAEGAKNYWTEVSELHKVRNLGYEDIENGRDEWKRLKGIKVIPPSSQSKVQKPDVNEVAKEMKGMKAGKYKVDGLLGHWDGKGKWEWIEDKK